MTSPAQACPECGVALEGFAEGSVMGARCPHCGWTIAATNISPIHEDATRYDLTVTPDQAPDLDRVRRVAARTGTGWREARDVLTDSAVIAERLHAEDALAALRDLTSAGLDVRTEPPFPWLDERTHTEG